MSTMGHFYTPERLAREPAVCACGQPAVEYRNGFRCARCKRLEEGHRNHKELDPHERYRRSRLASGLPEYHVALKMR